MVILNSRAICGLLEMTPPWSGDGEHSWLGSEDRIGSMVHGLSHCWCNTLEEDLILYNHERPSKKKHSHTVFILNHWNLSVLSSCPLSTESVWRALRVSSCLAVGFSHISMEPHSSCLGLTCNSHRPAENQCLWRNSEVSASSSYAFWQHWSQYIALALLHLLEYLMIAWEHLDLIIQMSNSVGYLAS